MRKSRASVPTTLAVALAMVALLGPDDDAEARGPGCPAGMVLVSQRSLPAATRPEKPLPDYCIDRYEGSLVELAGDGGPERPYSPYETVKGRRRARRLARRGGSAGVHLARRGGRRVQGVAQAPLHRARVDDGVPRKRPTTFPYGDERKPGYCNDAGTAPLATYYPAEARTRSAPRR